MGPSPERLIGRLRRHVADERVLVAIAEVPRQRFVPPEYRDAAWRNRPLPIGAGQTISQPLGVARMAEALDLAPEDRVLDVGTGSGYHAAILARLAGHVWSIERNPGLSQQAAENLAAAGIEGVTLVVGDGSAGLPDEAPFDAINVGAAATEAAATTLARQLALGGRMVAPVGHGDQRLLLARRTERGYERAGLEPVRFVPLVEGEPPVATDGGT
jgi:protein-L-isoaspartate(D-aspartate) O-methyltransferase